MDQQQSRKIIDLMAEGCDPLTGDKLSPESPYCAPEVIAALMAAARAMRRRHNKAVNTGKPWKPGEDAELRSAFQRNVPDAQIARQLGRSRFAVEQRLIKLGLTTRTDPKPGYHDKAEERVAVYA